MSKPTIDYSILSKEQLLELILSPDTLPQDMLKLNRALRSALRQDEMVILDAEKKAKEDSTQQQRLLKATKSALFSTRKDMIKAFANMNKLINTVSMLKNLEDFKARIAVYSDKQVLFTDALKAHEQNLNKVNATSKT